MLNLSILSAASRAVHDALAEQAPALGRLERLTLTPQPLPPRSALAIHSRFDALMLNPQPLPPKASSLFGPLSRLIDDCGTVVPRRIPIPPPAPWDAQAALEAMLGGAGMPSRPPIKFF